MAARAHDLDVNSLRRGTPGTSDASIIDRSRREPVAFAELFDRHAADVYRYAARRIGDDLAEDLLSETFSVAFQQRHRYDLSRADARPWLLGILTNLGRRQRRAEARRWRAMARTAGASPSEPMADRVVAQVSAEAVRAELAGALASMPARYRDVLVLIAWAGLDYAETAAALGIPIGTVRSRMHRARAALRDALGGVNPVGADEERVDG